MTYRDRKKHADALEEAQDAASGRVTVSRGDGLQPAIPNLRVRVGASQHIKVGEHAAVGEPGDYFEGDEVEMEGPSAHHLEELGFVTIIGEAS